MLLQLTIAFLFAYAWLFTITQHATAQTSPQLTSTIHAEDFYFESSISALRVNELSRNDATSCSSTACHGGPRPGVNNTAAMRGSEYPQWLARDPHARSWQTLGSPRAVQIMSRLRIMEDQQIVDPVAFKNCTACHSPANNQSNPIQSNHGVDCDSCHGPSGSWRTTHYRAEFPQFNHANDRSDFVGAQEFGWVVNQNVLARARVCAGCHVGDTAQFVDHDMLAAGHPALTFEMTSYHQQLPKHWREPASAYTSGYQAGLWLAGQLASLDAQLAQIEATAERARPEQPWTDFAVFACAQCHRNNQVASTAAHAPSKLVLLQSAQWSSWNRWGLQSLLETQNHHPSSQSLRGALQQLENLLAQPTTNRSVSHVAAAAHDARSQLDRWLEESGLTTGNSRWGQSGKLHYHGEEFSADSILRLLPTNLRLESWEEQTQFYLAQRLIPTDSSTEKIAQRLRQSLIFDPSNKWERYNTTPISQATTQELQSRILNFKNLHFDTRP